MKKNKWFGWAFVAAMVGTGFTACTNETEEVLAQESEIKLTSEITPSRVTSLNYQSTQIVSGQQVGITITNAVGTHINQPWTAGNDGILNNIGEKVYWGTEKATITAYHPYNKDWTFNEDNNFSVSTNQTSNSNYLASDLLWSQLENQTKKESPVTLTFTHKLAKINVTLTSTDIPTSDLASATISICGTKVATTFNPSTGTLGTATGNSVDIEAGKNSKTASAIIVPQTIEAGTRLIKIAIDNKIYHYSLPAETTFYTGQSYSYTLTVKNKLLEVSAKMNITDWSDNPLTGDANETTEVEEKVVHVETAGNLYTYIDENEKSTITSLTVTGNLNSDDIRFIREMAGGADNLDDAASGSISINSSLVSLDISGCTIVEGGNSFFQGWTEDEKYYTASNNLGWYAFAYTNLEDVKLPETITTLGYYVLGGSKIKEIKIPESVVEFDGGYLFAETQTLTTIHLPANIGFFGPYAAFSQCPNLETITIDSNNEHWVVAEDGLLYANYENDYILYCCPGANTSATIDSKTTIIGYDAFAYSKIQSLEIPESVKSIEAGAFRQCTNLTSITFKSTTPPNMNYEIYEDGFIWSPFMEFEVENCIFNVPTSSADNYRTADGWNLYELKIEEY